MFLSNLKNDKNGDVKGFFSESSNMEIHARLNTLPTVDEWYTVHHSLMSGSLTSVQIIRNDANSMPELFTEGVTVKLLQGKKYVNMSVF